MFISDLAIRRPIITIVSMVTLVVFGLVSLFLLQTDEFPDVAVPLVVVSIPYPGASPDNVERELVDPLEEAIAGISGVKKVQSSALDSFATVLVQFNYEKDLNEATQEIRDKINSIRNDLPPEMKEPVLTKINPTDFPILSLALSSKTLSVGQLTLLADPGITRRLRALSGVGQVDLAGGNEREMTVDLKPDALAAAKISVAEVVNALQTQNLSAPVRRLLGESDERAIRLGGKVQGAEDFAQIVVADRGGRVIRLGDVASVHAGVEEPRSGASFSGREAVGIDVRKSKGYSTTAVADAVRAEIERITPTLPAGVELKVVRDAGVRVRNSVANVRDALIEGALLTVLTVFLFLNSWRSTVITGLALPVSVIASFVAVLAFGFTLNTMSLLGLSLAIGILIDDAIVVRENIVRHVEQGSDHFKAAHEGTSEIGLAVTATTLSIVVVFIPIAFLGGMAGQWFKPFGLTIACSVLVSLFVSFSVDPMLSAYWRDRHGPLHTRWFLSRWLGYFNLWFDRQAERYKSVIAWALDHRYSMITLAVASFIGALALPAMGIIPAALVPIQDNSMFSIDLDVPPGSNLEYAKAKAQEVARIARKRPEVAYTYIAMGREGDVVDEGSVFVKLLPKAERSRIQADIEADIRSEIVKISGLMSAIGGGWNPGEKAIQIQLKGQQAGELTRLAQQVAAEMRQVPGAVDVDLSTKGQKPELEVQIDRGMAGSLGLTVGQVAQALRPAFAGIDVGDWVDPSGETRDVTIRLAPAARTVVADLESMPLVVPGPDGPRTIP